MMSLFDFDFSQETTKETLIKASNAAYDQGQPILDDQEFDLLANTGIEIDPRNFRCKVDHPFPMGSLNKIKTAEDFMKWLGSAKAIAKTPKLDGLSVRLRYVAGKLIQAITRGDGYVGNDVTANALCCNVPKALKQPLDVEIRCEAAIKKIHADKFDKNLRNVAAGMLGAKDPRPELALIDFIAIDIVTGSPMSVNEKWELLASLLDYDYRVDQTYGNCGNVPLGLGDNPFSFLEEIYEGWKDYLPYKVDGMVVEKFDDINAPVPVETELLPKNKVALKFATEAKETTISDIKWTLGQHQKLTPVLNVETVEIDGTNVSNVSASNYSLLKAAGLGIGAKVMVIKSGEIIPKVAEVLVPSIIGLDLPNCPACGFGAVISDSGVDALCKNPECEGTELVKLIKTFDLFGIDFISGSTIENLSMAGYDTLEKIFALSEADIAALPGFGQKSAEYLVKALKSVELTEAKIVKSAFLRGIGERKATPLLNHYGSLVNFLAEVMVDGLAPIEGFGPVQTELINQNIGKIADQLARFKALGVKIIPHEAPKQGNLVVCCTGTCSQYPRKELKAILEGKGYTMIDTVTKETSLLLCEDPQGGSSKLVKARKQGIGIQSYDDFFAN